MMALFLISQPAMSNYCTFTNFTKISVCLVDSVILFSIPSFSSNMNILWDFMMGSKCEFGRVHYIVHNEFLHMLFDISLISYAIHEPGIKMGNGVLILGIFVTHLSVSSGMDKRNSESVQLPSTRESIFEDSVKSLNYIKVTLS